MLIIHCLNDTTDIKEVSKGYIRANPLYTPYISDQYPLDCLRNKRESKAMNKLIISLDLRFKAITIVLLKSIT